MAGYLEKRGKRSWRLIVSHGFDSYGNRIKYTKSIKANSRREADKELVNFVYEVENGIVLQNSSIERIAICDGLVRLRSQRLTEAKLTPNSFASSSWLRAHCLRMHKIKSEYSTALPPLSHQLLLL